jgi:predicted amidohydrolase YtcJ
MAYAEHRLGSDRIRGAYIWKSFMDPRSTNKTHLITKPIEHLPLGSDFPIEDVNPMKGIYAAVTRRFENGTVPVGWEGQEGWYPEER